MKSAKRYIVILLIVSLFCAIDNVYAADCRNRLNSKECLEVCQYRNKSSDTSILGVSFSGTKYEIDYQSAQTNVGRSREETGRNYGTDYSTDLRDFNTIFSKYAEVINVDTFGDSDLCTNNAYQVKKDSNDHFTCFDDDGKSCKNKYGNKIKATYKLDEERPTVDTNGGVKISDEGVKTREENEQKAVDTLTEKKIKLKEKEINSGSDCSGIFGEAVTADINLALKYIKYIGPVLVVVLGMLDFIKAVASGDNDSFNKAWKRLLTRLIVAILLFFVVDLIKFLFHVFGITVPEQCLK